MRQPEFNSNDEDFNSQDSLFWSEKEWQDYLRVADLEVAKFLIAYQKLRNHPSRLEESARVLKWEGIECVMVAQSEKGLDESSIQALMQAIELLIDSMKEEAEAVAYTVHRHLGFVMARGLLLFLSKLWEFILKNAGGVLSPSIVWEYAMGLRNCEYHVLMAFNAIDMGEITVGACHMKHALTGINIPMAIVQNLPTDTHYKWLGTLKKDIMDALFDFREICLESLRSCRDENKHLDDGSGD